MWNKCTFEFLSAYTSFNFCFTKATKEIKFFLNVVLAYLLFLKNNLARCHVKLNRTKGRVPQSSHSFTDSDQNKQVWKCPQIENHSLWTSWVLNSLPSLAHIWIIFSVQFNLHLSFQSLKLTYVTPVCHAVLPVWNNDIHFYL